MTIVNKMEKINGEFVHTYAEHEKIYTLKESEYDKVEEIKNKLYKRAAERFFGLLEFAKDLENEKQNFELRYASPIEDYVLDNGEVVFSFHENKEKNIRINIGSHKLSAAIGIKIEDFPFLKDEIVKVFTNENRVKLIGSNIWKIYNKIKAA